MKLADKFYKKCDSENNVQNLYTMNFTFLLFSTSTVMNIVQFHCLFILTLFHFNYLFVFCLQTNSSGLSSSGNAGITIKDITDDDNTVSSVCYYPRLSKKKFLAVFNMLIISTCVHTLLWINKCHSISCLLSNYCNLILGLLWQTWRLFVWNLFDLKLLWFT